MPAYFRFLALLAFKIFSDEQIIILIFLFLQIDGLIFCKHFLVCDLFDLVVGLGKESLLS
uniref:Uncharacterized protein n=1 Tax=Arundo donax TaxID=35708 RepID=A0A0A9D4Y0_ARUDO